LRREGRRALYKFMFTGIMYVVEILDESNLLISQYTSLYRDIFFHVCSSN
jgi:hypothetical protein